MTPSSLDELDMTYGRERFVTSTAEPTLETRNRQTIEQFMQVFSEGDVDAILDYMSDSATWWVGGTIDGISGTKDKKAFGQMLSELSGLATTGAIRLTPLEWTVQGDRVAVETESYCELHNGRVYNNLYHFLFVLDDGKITQVKEFLDTEHTRSVFLG